jgi:hypothetical protein
VVEVDVARIVRSSGNRIVSTARAALSGCEGGLPAFLIHGLRFSEGRSRSRSLICSIDGSRTASRIKVRLGDEPDRIGQRCRATHGWRQRGVVAQAFAGAEPLERDGEELDAGE